MENDIEIIEFMLNCQSGIEMLKYIVGEGGSWKG